MRHKRRQVGVRPAAAARPLPIGTGGGWFDLAGVGDWTPGAWQANSPRKLDTVLAANAVFACVTLIASDVGKLRPRLVELADGIWTEVDRASPFWPVLRRPNRFQNHIQFKEWWIASKLLRGNAVGLLQRDARSIPEAIYILDWQHVTPLVAPDGAVYYQLGEDNLAGLDAASIVVPASEIIHDRMNCLFHPLVGTSPLFAAGASAEHALKIQHNSAQFFANNSSPGGVLVAPGKISEANARELREAWHKNYGGANAGRIAVLSEDLKFTPMRMSAVESQLAEQVALSAQIICSAFHVPPSMIGMGAEPTYANGEDRTSRYYSQCLQSHIEALELCLDEALGLTTAKDGRMLGVELDLSGLLRMDSKTQHEALTIAIKGQLMATNEARRVINLPPVPGGDTIYAQQQNFSLEALSKQELPDPNPPPPEPATPLPPADDGAAKALAADLAALIAKQAEVAATLQASAGALAAEREAAAAVTKATEEEQRRADESERMAQAILSRFTGASRAA